MSQISSYINQANEELEAATLLLEKNYYRACISRCYYAIYCIVQALLIVKNINTRSHRGVIPLRGSQKSKVKSQK